MFSLPFCEKMAAYIKSIRQQAAEPFARTKLTPQVSF
jgi:hypothetical protein